MTVPCSDTQPSNCTKVETQFVDVEASSAEAAAIPWKDMQIDTTPDPLAADQSMKGIKNYTALKLVALGMLPKTIQGHIDHATGQWVGNKFKLQVCRGQNLRCDGWHLTLGAGEECSPRDDKRHRHRAFRHHEVCCRGCEHKDVSRPLRWVDDQRAMLRASGDRRRLHDHPRHFSRLAAALCRQTRMLRVGHGSSLRKELPGLACTLDLRRPNL